MKYTNQTFTLPTCSKPMSDLEYDLAVGNISQEEFNAKIRKGISTETPTAA